MDNNKFYKSRGNDFSNSLTRSDSFWTQNRAQNNHAVPDDVEEWKELIRSQVFTSKEKPPESNIVWEKKAPLPEIGATKSQKETPMTSENGGESDDEFHEELSFPKRSKQLGYGKNKVGNSFASQKLKSQSLDIFPNHYEIDRRSKMNRGLRPLGVQRLSSVPEGRGPSAFRAHTLPKDLPERPLAPTPMLTPRDRNLPPRIRVPTPRKREYSLYERIPSRSRGDLRTQSLDLEPKRAPAPSPEFMAAPPATSSDFLNGSDGENEPPVLQPKLTADQNNSFHKRQSSPSMFHGSQVLNSRHTTNIVNDSQKMLQDIQIPAEDDHD